jgi:hypothetical protein
MSDSLIQVHRLPADVARMVAETVTSAVADASRQRDEARAVLAYFARLPAAAPPPDVPVLEWHAAVMGARAALTPPSDPA